MNEEAATEPRQYRIRVVVKTRENLRVNRFLGMADIHLTCLRNEQDIKVIGSKRNLIIRIFYILV